MSAQGRTARSAPAAPLESLHRALRLRDLIPFYVAAVVSVQWWSTAAQFGPASLSLWLIAMVCFFLPSGLVVMELSSRYPEEGGLYQWTKHAFGDAHGFLVGWMYLVTNFVLLPSLLLFVSGTAVYIGGSHWLWLGENPFYQAGLCVALLWLITGANIIGLERAKWIPTIAALFVGLSLAVLLTAAYLASQRFGSATPFTRGALVPAFAEPAVLPFFATMIMAFAGFDLAPLMGGEIVNPRRTVPAAMLISGVIITLLYMLGTTALLVAIPREQIGTINGIPEAVGALGNRIGIPWLGAVEAGVLTLGVVGPLAGSITAVARLPFVVGLDGYLPAALGRVHPRWGSPYVALLTQATISSLVLLAAISGTGVKEAYHALLDISLILILLSYVYMFVALPVFRARFGAPHGVLLVPGGRWGTWLVAGLGVAMCVIAIVLAVVPPSDSPQPWLFIAKVLGGCIALVLPGLLFYRRGTS